MVFGMGVFVIVAAMLNKVYSTVPALLNDSINYTFWYMREATVAVYVINLPALWPVLRKLLPILTGRGSSAKSRGDTTNMNNSTSWPASRRRMQSTNIDDDDDGFEMKTKGNNADADSEGGSTAQASRTYFNSSQEHIMESGHGDVKGGFSNDTSVLEIQQDVTYTVEHGPGTGSPLPRVVTYERKTGPGYQANVQAGKNQSGKNYQM